MLYGIYLLISQLLSFFLENLLYLEIYIATTQHSNS